MKKVKVNAYAKLNLTLNVTGKSEGYHELDSLVCSLSLCDTIVAFPRSDKTVSVEYHGGIPFSVAKENDNAYKAATRFVEAFDTFGADIKIKKRIPIASGLGGSSSDIAGVILAMEKLYHTGRDIKALADELGSDSGYMLTGGFARLKGRGEKVENLAIDSARAYYVVCAYGRSGTSECFALYDKKPDKKRADTSRAVKAIVAGDFTALKKSMYNALFAPAVELSPDVARTKREFENMNVTPYLSGSGGTIYSLFASKKDARLAQKKLKKIKINTVISAIIEP